MKKRYPCVQEPAGSSNITVADAIVSAVEIRLNLIKGEKWEGFYLRDVRKVLSRRQWEKFNQWFEGQTGIIHQGKLVVYRTDLERFLRRKESFN